MPSRTRPLLAWPAAVLVALAGVASLAAATAGGGVGYQELEREHAVQRAHADALLATMASDQASPLARAVAVANAGTVAQADLLGISPSTPAPAASSASPSQALGVLLTRHGVAPGPEARRSIRRLDLLAEPARGALTRFVDAFLVFERTTQSAHEGADRGRLETLRQISAALDPASAWRETAEPGSTPWRALADAGVELAPVLAARQGLADAAVALDAALAAPGSVGPSAPAFVNLCPSFAIDLARTANVHKRECALIIDAGGNDYYRNNAGGAPTFGAEAGGERVLSTVAAVVDLAGDDRYGDPARPRSVGANGGASGLFVPMMAGFLLDAAGNDRYVGANYGVNGGGAAGGMGHLVDAGGNDTYTTQGSGVNGGGNVFGIGLLVDVGGGDVFSAWSGGANGGGALGVGILLAADGSDSYTVGGSGNGGAFLGRGLLVDQGGNDTYRGLAGGVNGGASAGVGLLLDQGGRDRYSDRDRTPETGPCSGTGIDRTVAPKCLVGAQVDVR